jgi:hypothetical protein
MPTTDPRIDAYIAKAPEFARPILERVRKGFHKGCPKLVETIKWGSPHFEHEGLLGGMAAFKRHVSFHLWRGKDLEDPEGLFAGVGDTEMCAAKVGSVKETPTQAVLAGYVRRAARFNEALGASKGAKKAARRPAPKMPADLAAALKGNAKARATFEGFPPSAKRDYVEWITGAKREATRAKRLATTLEWLAEGKRRNWRYERC